MTNRIEPAVSDFEWRQFEHNGRDQLMPRYFAHCDHPSFIAKHNAALPSDDPRKITREKIEAMRALWELACTCGVVTRDDDRRWTAAQTIVPQMIDALESYLPPE